MSDAKKSIRVVIIGAGIAGLAAAYGLKDLPGVQVRIFEKRREEECLDGGYPIHLASVGHKFYNTRRQALQRLLSSEDYLRLLRRRNVFPACHDGVTILDSKGKIAWRMVKSPGQKCLMERQALIAILKEGLQTATKAVALEPDHVATHKWREDTHITDEIEDLIGEKLNSLRNWTSMDENDPPSSPRPPVDKRDTFGNPLPKEHTQDTDVELTPPTVRLKGIRIEYGRGVKAIQRTTDGWSVNLWDGEMITCDLLIGADGMFSTVRRTLYPPRVGVKDEGYEALPYTIINLRATTSAVRRWIGDEDSMNLICGKGWSAAFMALDYPSPLDSSRPPQNGNVNSSVRSEKSLGSDTYVAITIPHPQSEIREAISLLPEAEHGNSFIRDILADPGLESARAFPLWTSRRTCVGGRRAVLIGDASHGMVPYCGAGASAGLADAAELVEVLRNHLIFGGDLDHLLDEFGRDQKRNNDPLIAQSRKVLWIAQGDNLAKRILRKVVFGALETGEKVSKERREAEKKLVRWKGQQGK